MTDKDKAFIDALTKFNSMCETYKSIFGESSLDRVSYLVLVIFQPRN